MGWPSAMISRCICDVSISMKPRPIATKNTSSGPCRESDASIARHPERQQDAERGQHASRSCTRTPSVATAFMLWLEHAEIQQRRSADVAQPQHVEEERAVVGRRGDVDGIAVAGTRGCLPAWVRRGECLVDGDPRAERHVELQPRRFAIERVELGVGERRRLTRMVPTPSGRSAVESRRSSAA